MVFMRDRVLPGNVEYLAHRRAAGPRDHVVPPIVEELKKQAKAQGLWNLFLPAESGLMQLEYAPIAELPGWSLDQELPHLLGSERQKREWLAPLLAGEIRSAFAMTEPEVASSDATNIATRIERDGEAYVINGRKWWTSRAMDPQCTFSS